MYDPMMNKGDDKINEEMEARMREEARAVLLGKSFLIDDDAFDGLSPKVLQATTEAITHHHPGASATSDGTLVSATDFAQHPLVVVEVRTLVALLTLSYAPPPLLNLFSYLQEIEEFVKKQTGASEDDPFEVG